MGSPVENFVIPLLLELPGSNNENFHENLMLSFRPCLLHHGEEFSGEVPVDPKSLPALLIESTLRWRIVKFKNEGSIY